jgi:phenylacetate-CoA ligase
LQELELHKIKRLVTHAYAHVPFYRQHLQEAGVHPDDIKTLDDFRQIPAITKQDIKRDPELFIASNAPRSRMQAGTTGGSTGEPLKFYHTPEETYWGWAATLRNRTWFGFEEGRRQAWIWGRSIDVPFSRSEQLQAWLRRQKWLNSYDMGEEKMEAFADTLVRFQPEFIFGYVSSLCLFAEYLKKRGITEIRPRAVQTAAEKLHDFERELIEGVFGCPVVDHYASMEIGVIAAQCLAGGMHVASEIRYLEVITDGRPAEPGEMGELVITNLVGFAMPFIRYKTGDLAIIEGQPCSCGRGLPLLREVVGRTTNFFQMPSGRLISGLYWSRVRRQVPGIKRFRAHQSSVDHIEVIYEVEDGFNGDLLEAKRQEVLSHLGEPINLSFRRVERIPLTSAGKHLFSTSDIPVDFAPVDAGSTDGSRAFFHAGTC